MGNFGLNEWLIISVVAIVLIQPKEIPRIYYQLGQWVQRWRRAYYAITDELLIMHESDASPPSSPKPPKQAKPQSKTVKPPKN